MDVDIFIPCFIDQMFPNTAVNMVKVLRKAGCTVHYNEEQTCCGQPAFNSGYWKESRSVCEKFVKDFRGDRPIVVPSGSCVGFVRNQYEKMLANSSIHNEVKNVQGRLYEFSEFMIDILKVDQLGAQLEGKAVYHDACGALRECGIKDSPRLLLQNVKGLELHEMADAETCCGFGGTFAVKYEPISIGMAMTKQRQSEELEADFLISTDSSCLMHLNGFFEKEGSQVKPMHLVDVLASGW